jgi:hypothetical protein
MKGGGMRQELKDSCGESERERGRRGEFMKMLKGVLKLRLDVGWDP